MAPPSDSLTMRAPSNVATNALLAFDAMPSAVAVIDGDGTIAVTNRAWRLFASMNGGSPEATGPGAGYLDACRRAADAGDPTAGAVADGIEAVLSGDRSHFELEYPCDGPDEPRWFLLQATPLADGSAAVVAHVNITRRKELEERLAYQAGHDPLTGLPNRRRLEERLTVLEPDVCAVLVCDLDGFKSVNDTFGHATGDELLVQVAARLKRVVRSDDVVGRVGGDEFIVICGGVDDGVAARLALRIEEALSAPYQVGADELVVGCSVGVAQRGAGERISDLLTSADQKMYDAKRARRRDVRP